MKIVKVMNLDEMIDRCATRRQLAMSLRESGYSYSRCAEIMHISKKGVWMHCTARSAPSFEFIFKEVSHD